MNAQSSRSPKERAPAALLGLWMALSCHPHGTASTPPPETREACEARKLGLLDFVGSLPTEAAAFPTRVTLPVSTLGAVPGNGPVFEISRNEITLDGELVGDPDLHVRMQRFRQWVTAWAGSSPPSTPATAPKRARSASPSTSRVLYVAAAADMDMQTIRSFVSSIPEWVELRLLVRTPAPLGKAPLGETSAAARELAARLLVEPDADRRRELAKQGYAAAADCAAVSQAAASVDALEPRKRWPALQAALVQGLPACDCGKLDTASLRLLVSAEQRAFAASLGWLPLSFLRDERCDATMPLRSLQKLIRQIEAFDAEFSAAFEKDAVSFGDVVVNDRLRVYFCEALPGETLAAKAKIGGTLYFRVPGAHPCQGWTFAPTSLGTPMGTWRRTAPVGAPPLAFHYWQAAEEVRVFGPVDPAAPGKPTDSRDHACEETVKLKGIDEHAIHTDHGAWFYDEAACLRSNDDAALSSGCVSAYAAGTPPPPPSAAAPEPLPR